VIELRPRDNSIQMPAEPACRRQWIGSSVLRMLEIFSRDRHPEVEGDNITVVVAAIGKKINNAMENAPLCMAFVP